VTTSPAQPLLGEQERNATVAAYAEPLAGTKSESGEIHANEPQPGT